MSLTFPDLDPAAMPGVSVENTIEWDSVAMVTLLSLIGEEFGMEIDFEAFEGATSFDALAARLHEMGVK